MTCSEFRELTAGTVVFQVAMIASGHTYNDAGTAVPKIKLDQKFVKVKDRREISLELTDFDLQLMYEGGAVADATLASMQNSIMCEMNADFVNFLVDSFNDKDGTMAEEGVPTDFYYTNTRYFPALTQKKRPTEDQIKDNQNYLMVLNDELSSIYSKKYTGVKTNEYRFLTNRLAVKNNNLLATGLNASDKAFDLLLQGLNKEQGDHFTQLGYH